MWPAELLSPAELSTLTGYVQPSAQKRWLRMAGIAFIDMAGRGPIVRRDDVRPATNESAINLQAFKPRGRHAGRKAA
jgi:hypothetical protein